MRQVIVTEQMEEAMNNQVAEMIGNRLALLGSLTRDGLEGEHNIAEQNRCAGRKAKPRLPSRKRKHICRHVPPPIIAIESLLLGSVGEGDAKLYGPLPGEPECRGPVGESESCGIAGEPFGGRTNPAPVGAGRGDVDRGNPSQLWPARAHRPLTRLVGAYYAGDEFVPDHVLIR